MKINLFFFVSNFNYGGASIAILNLLKGLSRKKFNINIIYIGDSDYKKNIPSDVNIINIKTNSYFLKTFFGFFKIRKIILQRIKNKKKNLFVSNINYSNILSILFLRKIKNLKIFLYERTSLHELNLFFNLTNFIKNMIIKMSIRTIYPRADKVITNSYTLKRELRFMFNVNADVIYSGTIEKILKKKKIKKKNYIKLISVGRFSNQKNHEFLIKMISKLKHIKYKLYIYGGGKLENDLTKLINNLGLKNKVFLLPFTNNKSKIYGDADLMLHTAFFEGLPNCFLDASNFNVPIIAYNGEGGISEALENGKYGELISHLDKNKFIKSINKFIKNPNQLRNKIQNSKKTLKKFTLNEVKSNFEKLALNEF